MGKVLGGSLKFWWVFFFLDGRRPTLSGALGIIFLCFWLRTDMSCSVFFIWYYLFVFHGQFMVGVARVFCFRI